jgi:uncharacterized protein YegL
MTQPTIIRPGGEIARRQLHFIWLCDCSSSMSVDGKMSSLNNAISNAIPVIREGAASNPEVQLLMRVLAFADNAYWQVAQPTPVDQFSWVDLHANGLTSMGAALKLVADELKSPPMTGRELAPVLVLVTDGKPTDDFDAGLAALLAQPWGKNAYRVAIAIGKDVDFKRLERFTGNPESVLAANNPKQLVSGIKWVSTSVTKQASQPRSNPEQEKDQRWVIPPPRPMDEQSDSQTVW